MAISNKDKPSFTWLNMYYLLELTRLGPLKFGKYGSFHISSNQWYICKGAINSKLIKELTRKK